MTIDETENALFSCADDCNGTNAMQVVKVSNLMNVRDKFKVFIMSVRLCKSMRSISFPIFCFEFARNGSASLSSQEMDPKGYKP